MDGPAPGGEAAPAPAPLDVPEDAPLVVFLGDSISAGLHLPADRAFPAVVQRRLHEQGVPFRLVNAGVSGDTSAGGLARVDWVLRQDPDVLVVELGGNDGLRGLPLDSIEANLRGICERARAKGARVLLLGVRIPPSYGPYAADFDAIYERIAADLDVRLVPFFMEGVGGVAEQNLEDAMHPTPEGHATIAENVATALRELLDGGT
jgi:acyl-CoA thioesterase-1